MRIVRSAVVAGLLAVSVFVLTACKRTYPAPTLDPSSLTVLCLGDSITAGTHSDGDTGQFSYPGLLQTILKEYDPSIQVVNEGQDGWQVDDVSSHIGAWVSPVAPDIILLQIGTNDLEQGASPDETSRRLDLLITQIQLLAPKAHLYVASCTKVRNDNKPGLPILELEHFNSLIPKVVKDHDRRGHFIAFVDVYKRADFVGLDLGPDGEHPDDSGYRKMAEYWSWELQRHELSSQHPLYTKKGPMNEQ